MEQQLVVTDSEQQVAVQKMEMRTLSCVPGHSL